MILLTAIVLVAGFLLLAAAALCPPLTAAVAPILYGSLTACQFPCGSMRRLAVRPLLRRRRAAVVVVDILHRFSNFIDEQGFRSAGVGELWPDSAGYASAYPCAAVRLPSDELRCTFLAVGHGGCTVMETPDGRTLLYDAERSWRS